MVKVTPATIKQFAESQRVEFSWERQGNTYALECWAPEGKVFGASGTHFYSLYGDGFRDKPDWNKTLADLKDTVSYGFEDCDEDECDICDENKFD